VVLQLSVTDDARSERYSSQGHSAANCSPCNDRDAPRRAVDARRGDLPAPAADDRACSRDRWAARARVLRFRVSLPQCMARRQACRIRGRHPPGRPRDTVRIDTRHGTQPKWLRVLQPLTSAHPLADASRSRARRSRPNAMPGCDASPPIREPTRRISGRRRRQPRESGPRVVKGAVGNSPVGSTRSARSRIGPSFRR